MTHIQEQILRAVLFDPAQLRSIIASATNPQYVISFLRKLLPARVGIEIDTIFENVDCYAITTIHNEYRKSLLLEPDSSVAGGGVELRISFKNLLKAKALKSYLNDLLSNRVSLSKGGGIHFHVDLKGYSQPAEEVRKRLSKYSYYLYKCVFRKPRNHKRSGSNYYRAEEVQNVNICVYRNNKYTVEYRFMHSRDYTYTELMSALLCCSLVTTAVRERTKFNKDLSDKILLLREEYRRNKRNEL